LRACIGDDAIDLPKTERAAVRRGKDRACGFAAGERTQAGREFVGDGQKPHLVALAVPDDDQVLVYEHVLDPKGSQFGSADSCFAEELQHGPISGGAAGLDQAAKLARREAEFAIPKLDPNGLV
jgi:hypothetical protein